MQRKRILLLSLLLAFIGLTGVNGQTDAAFSTVPVVNGKVVFQQFIPNTGGANVTEQYALLQQWGKSKSKNPLLSGIRFDDKGRTVTISSGQELQLAASTAGVDKITMRYRFDTSVTNAGCMLVVRDITYQNEQPGSGSVFPKTYTAEQMITDQAINASGEERELRNNTRKATLAFLNTLYEELSAL